MAESIGIRIPFSDITRIALECSNCGAEITFDISKAEQRNMNTNTIKKCSVCASNLPASLNEGFGHIYGWYDSVIKAKLEDKIAFRIKNTSERPLLGFW